jgi:hypothetical protein
VSPGSSTRRWVGAAIGSIAVGLGVFALLGTMISIGSGSCLDCGGFPGLISRIHTFAWGDGRWGVPVHGLVVTRTPNKSLIAVPDALVCQTTSYRAWNNQCHDLLSKSAPDGAFDLTLDFTYETLNDELVSWQEEESVMVVAPGCAPQELVVRDPGSPDARRRAAPRRGRGLELVRQVTLDCSQRSSLLAPIPISDLPLSD